MSLFTKLANAIFSPVDAGGNQRRVANGDAQRWGTEIERALAVFQAGGGIIFPDKATMDGTLTYAANQMAWVLGDSTNANNGIYRKIGASGSGSWVRLGDLPYSVIPMTNAGAGTANAIVATPSLPLPTAPGSALFTVNIVAANTGNVTINGKPLRTNSGNEISADGLTAGSMPVFLDLGDHYRLLSDQASAAIQAAAEDAANRAEDARDAALAAVPSVYPASIAVLKTIDTVEHQSAYVLDRRRGGSFTFDPSDLSAGLLGFPFVSRSVNAANNTLNMAGGTAQFNAGTDTITFAGHGFTTDDFIYVGSSVNGLTANRFYRVINPTTNTFQIAEVGSTTVIDITGSTNATIFQAHQMTRGLSMIVTTAGGGLSVGDIVYVGVPTGWYVSLHGSRADAYALSNPIDLTDTTVPELRLFLDPNEGRVVIPNGFARDGSQGGWVREFGGAADPQWYGLSPTATPSENQDALQACFDANSTVLLPTWPGTIDIDNAVLARAGSTVKWSGTFVRLTASTWLGGVIAAYPFRFPVNERIKQVQFLDPLVDGNDQGWPSDADFGENGIGGALCEELIIRGGVMRNMRMGKRNHIGTGGKGVQVENTVSHCLVEGTTMVDCSIGIETGGEVNTPSRNITYRNIKLVRCGRPISLMHSGDGANNTVDVNSCVIEGVDMFDCGLEDVLPDDDPSMAQAYGAICIDRYSNASLKGLVLRNSPSYGEIGALIRHYRGDYVDIDITFSGDTIHLIDSETRPTGGGSSGANQFGLAGSRNNCRYLVRHIRGEADRALACASGDAANHANNVYEVITDVINIELFNAASELSDLYGKFAKADLTRYVEGFLHLVGSRFSRNYPSTTTAYIERSFGINGLTFTPGSGVQNIGTDSAEDISLNRNGSPRLRLTESGMTISGLSTYADDSAAAADGVPVGGVYRLSVAGGNLRVRVT